MLPVMDFFGKNGDTKSHTPPQRLPSGGFTDSAPHTVSHTMASLRWPPPKRPPKSVLVPLVASLRLRHHLNPGVTLRPSRDMMTSVSPMITWDSWLPLRAASSRSRQVNFNGLKPEQSAGIANGSKVQLDCGA